MKYLFVFSFLVVWKTAAQTDDFLHQYKIKADSNVAKDFHQRKALSTEELYYKTNPKAATASMSKARYLVLEKLRTSKRIRYYLGDIFRFKSKDGRVWNEELAMITDSSFFTSRIDLDKNYFAYTEFKLRDISCIYKRPLRKGLRFGLNSSVIFGVGEPLINTIQYGIPFDANLMLRRAAILGFTNLALQNIDKLFRRTKLNDNKRLRVFRGY